jgi:hypothetical protein
MRWLAAPVKTVRPAGLVILAALVFLAAGCGGDDERSATDWAGDVCSAISTWSDSVTSTAESLGAGGLSEEALRDAADEFEGATNDFVEELRDLGPPNVEGGEEAQESIDQFADEVDESVSELEQAVDEASDVSGIVAAATAASAALSTLGELVSTTVATLGAAGNELAEAFAEADSCDELGSEGSG